MITPKRITLKDIAKAAGCSVSATSKVLNQVRGGAGVGAELRQRILDCAEQLGYQTNQAARSLKQGRSNGIALLLGPQPQSHFWTQLSNSLQDAARTAGQQAFIITDIDELSELHKSSRIDGAVYLRGAYAPQHFKALTQTALPAISIDVELRSSFNAELIPNLKDATFAAVAQMKDLGKDTIFWLYPTFDGKRIDDDRFPFIQAACNSYRLNLQEIEAPSPSKAYKETDANAAYQAIINRFKEKDSAGLLVYNDTMLSGALAAFHHLHLRIPQDFAICSYDNVSASQMFPPISSIDLGMHDLGKAAIHSVLQRIQDTEFHHQNEIQAQFISRHSTGEDYEH